MSKELITLAIDMGAESGRVIAVHFDGESLQVDELHRFANGPVNVRGTLFWDVIGPWREIQMGIDRAFFSFLQPGCGYLMRRFCPA